MEQAGPLDVCQRCNGRGWLVTDAGAAARCSCHGRVTVPELVQAAGLPLRYRSCSLESFKVGWTETGRGQLMAARAACQRYVESFLRPDGSFAETGLILIGPPGSGKTHLAAAVLIELVSRYRLRGRFVDFTSLLHQIRSTFDPSSPDSKREILDPIINAELLVLDELGAQKPTAWVADLLYLVINTRYASRLPTLFTTNYALEVERQNERTNEVIGSPSAMLLSYRIPAMLVSRLYEMAKPVYLDALGEDTDYRQVIQRHSV